jgi:hypothetical protein
MVKEPERLRLSLRSEVGMLSSEKPPSNNRFHQSGAT